jgi:aminopeptidase
MGQFEEKLVKYAELAVKIGVNLQKGQILHISAPILAADFVEQVVKAAYEVGAADVIVAWNDEKVTRLRFDLAPDEAFENFPDWEVQKMESLVEKDAAFMTVFSQDPDLLAGVDPKRVAMTQRTAGQKLQKSRAALMSGAVSRTVVSTPTPEWAKKVFPELETDAAIDALWDQIFKITRVSEPNPIESWKVHGANFLKKLDFLNGQQFKALHYKGEGTDLVLELPENHVWIGGGLENAKGVYVYPNIPTEEIFTAPKRDGVNGTVTSTKPLNYAGTMIENFTFTFENGRIVGVTAEKGEETLKNLVETDEGSHYLGEVALVPNASPISETGLIFYNTLFDENASCHLAIGTAYSFNVKGGTSMSQEELQASGLNNSITHVDFMMGSATLDIDGETVDGARVPLFRNGNWAL